MTDSPLVTRVSPLKTCISSPVPPFWVIVTVKVVVTITEALILTSSVTIIEAPFSKLVSLTVNEDIP